MEVYTKAPTDYRIENVNISTSIYGTLRNTKFLWNFHIIKPTEFTCTHEESRIEKHIIIDFSTESNTSESVRMSVMQLNNLKHNVANLLKHTNRLKTKLQQN